MLGDFYCKLTEKTEQLLAPFAFPRLGVCYAAAFAGAAAAGVILLRYASPAMLYSKYS